MGNMALACDHSDSAEHLLALPHETQHIDCLNILLMPVLLATRKTGEHACSSSDLQIQHCILQESVALLTCVSGKLHVSDAHDAR
jgi:hypothetical protein